MSETLVIVLRATSLLGFAAPMLLVRRRRQAPIMLADQRRGNRAPFVANVTAFALFYPVLLIFPGTRLSYATLLLALAGCILAAVGVAVVLRSRRELGSAWSFVPVAHGATGLVTTGPYRLVRHPIYLGLSVVALGQALAFAGWPAFLVLFAGIMPTFVWRAAAEEKLLMATFGERYTLSQAQTRMIIPRLL
jgi:protein-S-isoprenylcysteine O-methyltransferase Ste14